MRVLHVVPSLAPVSGGPTVAIRDLARALVEQGVTAEIAADNGNGPELLDVPLGRPVREDGVTVRYFRRSTRLLEFSWPLTSWLARNIDRYDVAHVHAVFSFAPLAAAVLARRAGVPYVVSPHGMLRRWALRNRRPALKKIALPLIRSTVLQRAGRVHFTSDQEREEAGELGLDAPSAVVPLGIDLSRANGAQAEDFLRQHPELTDRRVALFLSRLDPIKGVDDLLLPAFARMTDGDCGDFVLVLAGRGRPGYEERLRRQAAELGIGDRVFFVGFLDEHEKWAALQACDVVVLPSHSENFGVAVVEAMACGKPVIVTRNVPMHEQITMSRAGIAVPPDVGALARALARMLGDQEVRRQAGERARRLTLDSFSADATARAMSDVYGELVAEHRVGSSMGDT